MNDITPIFKNSSKKICKQCSEKSASSNVLVHGTVYGFFCVNEKWAVIKEASSLYSISNHGRIFSIKRKIIRKVQIDKDGYYRVTLHHHHSFFIHRLIGRYFVKGFKKTLQINHKNGDKKDNRLGNLEWITQRENLLHAQKNHLILRGDNHGRSKLKEREIFEIRALSGKKTHIEIAKKYKVCKATVTRVINKRTWKFL